MLISYLRTIVLYLVLIFVVRLMGKRQIGEMEPAEFVVTMLIANLASIPMQDSGIPLLTGLIPILTVLGAELVLSVLTVWCIPLRRLLCGKPVILVENGKILQKNLKKTRVNLDELTEFLRQNNILELETVKYAILETNGQISVFPYGSALPPSAKDAGIRGSDPYLPVTLISDGRVLRDNFDLLHLERGFLEEQLRAHNCTAKEVYLLTVDPRGKTVLIKKEAGV